MDESLLLFLNVFFFVFHVVLIVFNLTGWIFPVTRRWHAITVALTVFSWLVLGAFYGLGYCFLTDWHWEIRDRLGYANDSSSYIHFLVTRIPGVSIEEQIVDGITAWVFGIIVLLTIFVNVRDRIKRR